MTQEKTQVHIDIIDPKGGLYGALSSDQERWYVVNVAARTCTCPAGVYGARRTKRGMCRHMIAARTIARSLASMTPGERVVALRMRNIRVDVARVDVAGLGAPLARMRPRVAGEPAPASLAA